MKKILITGSNGFVGQELSLFLSNEFNIFGIGKNNNSLSSNLTYTKCSIEDFDAISKIVADIKPDIIIHLAAIVHKNNNDTSAKNYQLINYEATKHLAKCAEENNVKKFIFASTIEVFGDVSSIEITEETECLPDSFYAKSKYDAEKYLQSGPFSFDLYILRFTPLYGVGFSMNVDKRIFLIKNKLAYYFKNGDYSFSFCSILNVKEFIKSIINEEIEQGGVFILSDINNYKAIELINMYKEESKLLLKVKIPYKITTITFNIVGKLISVFVKKDIYLSSRNINKLLISRKYKSDKARNCSKKMTNDYYNTMFANKEIK